MKSLLLIGFWLLPLVPALALQNPVDREMRFQQILLLPAPELEIEEELQDVLALRYQVHAFADEFRAEVHGLAKRALFENISAIPTDLESYQNLRASENLAEDISDDVRYFYVRLIAVAADPKSNLNLQLRASVALNQIDQNLLSWSWEDQLQIESLLNELRDERMIGDGKYRRSVNLPKIETFDLKAFEAKLKGVQKIIASKAHDPKRLARAQNILKKRLKAALEEQRQNVGAPTPIYASTSEAGLVPGFRFPEGVVALTFDDGPSPEFTLPLVDVLNSHRDRQNPNGAPASFFWLAKSVSSFPDVVGEVVQQKQFTTNCHSWDHQNIGHASGQLVQHEVVDAVNYERQVYGRNFLFYRCPGGACSGPVRAAIANMNLIHASWSIDSLDWLLQDTESIVPFVIEQLQISKRGVILMHDIHAFSVAAAQQILAWIKQQNDSGQMAIRLYTLDDAVDLQNQQVKVLTSDKNRR